MRRRSTVIEEAASTAVDAAEVAIEVIDTLAGDVADVAARSGRTLFVRRRPSWLVTLVGAALIVIGVVAVIHTVMSRRREREERDRQLGDALDGSFPASDPPAMTSPSA